MDQQLPCHAVQIEAGIQVGERAGKPVLIQLSADQLSGQRLRPKRTEKISGKAQRTNSPLIRGKRSSYRAAAFDAALFFHAAGRGETVIPVPAGIALPTDLVDGLPIRLGEDVGITGIFPEDLLQQRFAKCIQAHLSAQKWPQIGHAASDGGDASALQLFHVRVQRMPDRLQVRIKEDRAVMQHAPLPDILRVSGKFFSVHRHVVSPVEFRRNAERLQRADHRLTEKLKIDFPKTYSIGNKAEIEIPQIVIDRAAAGKPPHDLDIMLFDIFCMDLRLRILIFSDDDGIFVLPEHQIAPVARERIEYMKKKNQKGVDGFELVVFDLYDMVMDYLESKNFVNSYMRYEKRRGFNYIVRAVTTSMKVNEDDSIIVQKIVEQTPENAIVFLTGVGKCYPMLRSHKILNTLHQHGLRKTPVVLFFPGTYNEQELILFNEIKDDNYYRAFKLVK